MSHKMKRGLVADFKRFAVHDGPGIRTTVFLSGCSLRCRWCHNPECLESKAVLYFTENQCARCGDCVKACQFHVHTIQEGRHTIDFVRCRLCGKCVEACLSGALRLFGAEMSAEVVAVRLLEDIKFFQHTGGGVTFSGGEPLLQSEFCGEVMKRLRDHKVHIAVDTAGNVPWENIETIRSMTDLFLYDVKHTDPDVHKGWTGCSNELILENLKDLDTLGALIEIRVPVIPGVNDDERTIADMGLLFRGLNNLKAVRLLAYHNMSGSKYAAMGMQYLMGDIKPPGRKKMKAMQAALKKHFGNILLPGDELIL
jgi:pyruvate formate lyase activating enzyme